MKPADLIETPVVWTHTDDAELPYTADADGTRYTIRINDFPAEPLYTLMADGIDLLDMLEPRN